MTTITLRQNAEVNRLTVKLEDGTKAEYNLAPLNRSQRNVIAGMVVMGLAVWVELLWRGAL